ncbi:MAG: LacI family DNA-binding transcriptional regulator [Candidatus Hinthialibacter antarcticus]|nr:LacI family DNA-binding transcriptional regulator [Candidatus Hinthialibacter antarcticus]
MQIAFEFHIQRDANTPSYIQLSDQIVEHITENTVQIGEFLPTENEICDLSGLSRMTVRKALERLNRLGMIDAVRGRGTFITAKEPIQSARYSLGFALRPERYIEEDPFYSEVLLGVTQESQLHQAPLAFIAGENISELDEIKQRYSMLKQMSGVIVAGQMPQAFLEYLVSTQIPCVFLNYFSNHYPFDAVASDQTEAGRLMGEHLAQLGHREFVYINGEEDNDNYIGRMDGFRRVIENIGGDVHVVYEAKGASSGRDAIARELAEGRRFTAAVCANDMIAIGVMNELQDRGVAVPEQVSVCGFDDVSMASNCRPLLTTVRSEKQEMGARAVRLLIDRLQNPQKTRETVLLEVTLVPRQSTAAVAVLA